ncbi:MAG TPA: helix-turn-helix transcriptional regulator [Bryobacteraceae bacterium]|nr:helix-turn-helix transcriptional regulator [Bryobacteraceae bacterium]
MVPAAEQQDQHWTEESSDAFAHRLAFDFIAQIEQRMDDHSISQSLLARKLKISEGAVSKLLNNPQNLTLRTIAKYSRALGIKAAIVAYDDGDSQNKAGPIASEVFTACWERSGRPHDAWDLDAAQSQHAATMTVALPYGIYYGAWATGSNCDYWNSPWTVHHTVHGGLSTHGTFFHSSTGCTTVGARADA